MPKTSWADFGQILSFMDRMKGRGEEDSLERLKDITSLQSTALDVEKKRRELAAPSPREEYFEEQRSQQIGSALEMFGNLYKTATPASKKLLGEQLGSLWGMMNKSDKTKYKMLVSHTPVNPRVQKAMWFEEVNPRPRMPIVKEGDGTWTNTPPRSEEYRRTWAEYDIASDEWSTLREMAVEGKSAEEMKLGGIPKQYQTDDSNVTAGRNELTKEIEFTDWREVKANHAEIQVAIDNKWATWGDIKRNNYVPLSAPREYVENGRPITVTQNRDLRDGAVRLDYKPAGPLEKRKEAPKELTDAIALIDSGITPATLKVKSPAVVSYYNQLANVIKAGGKERLYLQKNLQKSIVDKYPSNERYLPFVPKDVDTGFWFWAQGMLDKVPILSWVVPTPTVGGKGGNVMLVQADRLVRFTDKNNVEMEFWWSDLGKVAYDTNGVPIIQMLNAVPGDQLEYSWEELEKLRKRR